VSAFVVRDELVAAVIKRDGERCFYCGEQSARYELDHVVPKARGGSDDIENRVLACPACNAAKGTLPGWFFVIVREFPIPHRAEIARLKRLLIEGLRVGAPHSALARRIHRKADEWRALGEESTAADDPARFWYVAIEALLREVADAVEAEELEAA
jgi:hypothetical protein